MAIELRPLRTKRHLEMEFVVVFQHALASHAMPSRIFSKNPAHAGRGFQRLRIGFSSSNFPDHFAPIGLDVTLLATSLSGRRIHIAHASTQTASMPDLERRYRTRVVPSQSAEPAAQQA